MTSIFEITDWSHVASFFVWTLAVCAIARALFGSFLAAGLLHHLALHDAPRRLRMTRLNWEIRHHTKWDEGVGRGFPHAATREPPNAAGRRRQLPHHSLTSPAAPTTPQLLTDAEIETKGREFRQLARASLPWRAVTYFMNCFACQAFWTAALIYPLTVTDGEGQPAGLAAAMAKPAAWFFSAAAYSAAAVLLSVVQVRSIPPRAPERVAGAAGCKDCGK